MRTELALHLRVFPVTIEDQRTKTQQRDTIVFEKAHLQAAQLVGQSSKELIYRHYNRQGYDILNIGTPVKENVNLNLEEFYALYKQFQKD